MADIFFSYARDDRSRIEPIVRFLQAKNYEVWWDPSIIAGQDYREVLNKQLHEARCVIVAWSEHSIKSDWVIGEAGEGKKQKILVPICIDGSEPPVDFRNLQTINFERWEKQPRAKCARDLIAGVRRVLATATPTSDTPPAKLISDPPTVKPISDPPLVKPRPGPKRKRDKKSDADGGAVGCLVIVLLAAAVFAGGKLFRFF